MVVTLHAVVVVCCLGPQVRRLERPPPPRVRDAGRSGESPGTSPATIPVSNRSDIGDPMMLFPGDHKVSTRLFRVFVMTFQWYPELRQVMEAS